TYPTAVIVMINWADSALARELAQLNVLAVIQRPVPVGFAANHNEAIRLAPAEYHLIANDDVVVTPETIDRLVEFMKRPRNADVAVVSPKLMNPDGTLQPSTYAFPTLARAVLGISGLRDRLGLGLFARSVARILTPGIGRSRLW